MKITNFTDAHQALSQFYGLSKAYSLDTIRPFMVFLGNPQDQVKIIHVAGTSGKTSTSYYIAGLLKASGKTVGLTVSPHVDEINERVQINLEPLPEAIFCRELEVFLELVADSGLPLSYFEVMVAFAYWYFAKVQVDYAVIEVGLGGRIDGTNVITREDKVCVITNIGFDHMQILGDTLPEITAEKAGIIMAHNEVFTHDQPSEVLDVIKSTAEKKQAALHIHYEQPDSRLTNLPLFQQHNFGLAAEVVDYVLTLEGSGLSEEAVTTAVNTYVPARMEVVTYKQRTIIMDGAHNGQKMGALMGSIQEKYPGKTIAALVAFVEGDRRRMHEALQELLPHVDAVVFTEFAGVQDVPKQSVAAQTVRDYATQQHYEAVSIDTDPEAALQAVLDMPVDIVLVTGSFYLLNYIRPHIMKS